MTILIIAQKIKKCKGSFSKCKLHGTINDISIDFNTRKPKISLLLDTNELSIVEELKNENKLNIELKNIVNLVASTQINTFGNCFKRFAIIKT